MSSLLGFLLSHSLSIIIGLPLLGVLLIILLSPFEQKLYPKLISLVVTGLSFLYSCFIYSVYYLKHFEGYHFIEQIVWVKNLGISYHVAADGINLPMVLLTGILAVTSVLVSWNINHRTNEYFALMLAVLAGVFGLFVSLDLFFFILFYELASIPMYFLIGIWGSDYKVNNTVVTKEQAGVKLIIYLQLGGGLILLGALALYFCYGYYSSEAGTFNINQLAQFNWPVTIQKILFPIIFIGFGIEAGFFPFHTWLPNGHSAAPTALSMILAGVLLKMGTYGMLRVAINILPQGAVFWMKFFVILAVINILYGALCALAQKDIKYIIAYSSISHMGIVILGLGTFNILGYTGSVFQMFSHGIITAALFATAGFIYDKTHNRDITKLGGIGIRTPYLALFFVLGGLATLGLPGMSGFVAELLVFLGTFKIYPLLAVLAIFGLVITAVYILRTAQKIFFGPLNLIYDKTMDLIYTERLPLFILLGFVILAGFYPALITNVTNSDLAKFLARIGK